MLHIPIIPVKANEKQRKTYQQGKIDGLIAAMRIALETGDGETAALAIQKSITTLQLQQERKNGRFGK